MAGRGSQSPPTSSSKHGTAVARVQRNVAEKQRRDKLNGYISELANIVPMVSMSSKRLDKTSILRLSAAHLRLCKSSLGGKQKKSFKWCPNFLTNEQMREILESVDGFLMITTGNGKILFTSHSVERYLGHQDIDLIGHSLFTFVHPDDLDAVKDEMERLMLACTEKGTPCRCSFRCRLREKGQPRSEVVTYQSVHFVGGLTPSDSSTEDESGSKSVVGHMFKAFVKIMDVSPYNQLSLEEATADEYVTRHSLDGTIIFADHRLSTITGHMPHEVVGLSAYAYIHSEDTPVALFAHHLMFSSDKGTGMIVYRLRTRDDKYVYLKTVGCLQFDAATSKVDHFVCVNQQLNDSDGDLQLKYFVERYIPHIKGSSATSLFESVKALQNSSSKPSPAANRLNSQVQGSANQAQNPDLKASISETKFTQNGHKQGILSKQESFTEIEGGDILSSNSKSNLSSDDIPVLGINTLDTKYFSKTIHTSTLRNVDVIYVSSLDSTLSINKTSDNAAPKARPLESYELNTEEQSSGSSYKGTSNDISSLSSVQMPSRIFEAKEEAELMNSDEYSQSDHILANRELSKGSQMSDAYHFPENHFSNSPPVDFALRSKQLGDHSPFNDGNSVLDNSELKLTLMGSATSVSVLTHSAWPVEGYDLKEDISNSSMDYYHMPMEMNGETKASLPSQEDLNSFLSMRGNGDSLLPPANAWNDVYSTTEFAGPLASEGLLRNDEQFFVTNPNAKQLDPW